MSSLSYKTLVNNGPHNNRINLVFIGDGYTQSELDNKYLNDVNTNVNYLFKSGGLTEPFPSYANYFNIYAVSIASSESGADEPTKNVYKSTALDASFAWGFPDQIVDRSLFFNTKLADYAVSTAFTGTGIIPNIKVGLVNTDRSGGTGEFNGWAVSPGTEPNIMAHEIGHSFILLADEYSHIGGSPGVQEPFEVNVTWDKTGAKWSNWMGYDDGILGPIGVFEGAKYKIKGAYRATETSMMKESGQPFNAIGQEAFLLRLYRHIDHADDYSLKGTNYKNSNNIYSIGDYIGNPGAFIIDPIDQDKIKVEWFVNNAKVDNKSDIFSLDIQNLNLSNGKYSIDAVLEDPNPKVKKSNTIMKKTLNWQIKIDNSNTKWTTDGTFGDDTINLGDGNDVVSGQEGNDTIKGGKGNDTIKGGEGNDILHGGAGNDIIDCGAGDDTIDGGDGDDTISSGTGSDLLKGNNGSDKIYLKADGVWATSIDKDGNTVDYQAANISSSKTIYEKVSIVGKNKFDDVIEGNNGIDVLDLTAGSDAFFFHDSLSSFNSTLTLADDTFGRKNIGRFVSIETINGGDGDDLIDLTSPDTQISDAMIINAGVGNDIIWSSAGTDTLNGGDGIDILYGGKGIDTLTGGNGADTFKFCNQSGNDIIKDYNKADGDKLAFYIQNGDNKSVSFSGDKITWGSLQIQLEGLTLSSENDFIVEYDIVA